MIPGREPAEGARSGGGAGEPANMKQIENQLSLSLGYMLKCVLYTGRHRLSIQITVYYEYIHYCIYRDSVDGERVDL